MVSLAGVASTLALIGSGMSGEQSRHNVADPSSGPVVHLKSGEAGGAASGDKAMPNGGKYPGNPADRPGVKVYRPEKITTIEFDPKIRRVLDTSNGDFLITRSGHAGGVGQWTFGNLKTGGIAYGGFYSSGGGYGPTIYEIPSLKTGLGYKFPHLSRSEFDLGRIAELFRAEKDAVAPNHGVEVLVVDSRPETPNDDNSSDAKDKLDG